jgi:hypothetical protein
MADERGVVALTNLQIRCQAHAYGWFVRATKLCEGVVSGMVHRVH